MTKREEWHPPAWYECLTAVDWFSVSVFAVIGLVAIYRTATTQTPDEGLYLGIGVVAILCSPYLAQRAVVRRRLGILEEE